ncbi:MalT transcriptional regulator family protein [Streptomyces carminius]|uniref:hypothetical protein n=1 Tax=Streptomyces carminius TaxID=2665496 RepID=UPI0011B63153|nr:hypothetical protein [Streptomyces carminius]
MSPLSADGLSNDRTGHRLNPNSATVKDHVASMHLKCGVGNRVAAALLFRGIPVPRESQPV